MNFMVISDANLVTYPADFRGNETIELHRVGWAKSKPKGPRGPKGRNVGHFPGAQTLLRQL